MALFRRTKSPGDNRQRVTTPTGPLTQNTLSVAKEEKEPVVGHRRHKSEENIVLAVDPAVFNVEPAPELPPRNSSSGGSFGSATSTGYRRVHSSGTTIMSASFKTPGHAARKPQEDYFVPADTLRHMSGTGAGLLSSSPSSSTKTSPKMTSGHHHHHGGGHGERLMSMHDKIVSHNAPDFRASQKNRSIDKLVDNTDYSTPFDVLQEYEKNSGQPFTIPPPKPRRTPIHKTVRDTSELSEPPKEPPPPPPPQGDEAVTPEMERHNTVSPSAQPRSGSPSSNVTKGGDYDDPWDSNKFKRIQRPKADTISEPVKSTLGGSSLNIDPYKSPRGSNNELSEPEPPLPPRPPPHSPPTSSNHHHPHTSSSPPPVPESSRPRACTGESDYCEPADSYGGKGFVGNNNNNNGFNNNNNGYYVNSPPPHEGGMMHDYVNQPACPPKLPPRPKKHVYPPLDLTDVSPHSPDINQLPSLPPAFPIDASIVLEEQPWYHGRIGRDQAEDILRNQPDFSFLVRNSESCRMDYSLSIRDSTSPAAHGFIHLKISNHNMKGYVLGEFSNPFRSVPECISFYTQKPLTIKNIHHRRLGFPVGRIQFTHH